MCYYNSEIRQIHLFRDSSLRVRISENSNSIVNVTSCTLRERN